MKYIVVDLEMNPISREYKEERKICRQEIIEIGAVVLDENFLVLGEFKTLVKPQFNQEIYKKYETLTGISTDMVSGAPCFKDAFEMFQNWCESYHDSYEMLAWSENDYNQIVAEMKLKGISDIKVEEWCDFQKEFTDKLGVERPLALDKALNYAGVSFEGKRHDALCDARATAELVAIIRNEEKCKIVLNYVLEAFKPKSVSGTLGEMFDFSAMLALG